MFGSLIRRKSGPGGENGGSDPAFDSTSVSLSTSVPRPIERQLVRYAARFEDVVALAAEHNIHFLPPPPGA